MFDERIERVDTRKLTLWVKKTLSKAEESVNNGQRTRLVYAADVLAHYDARKKEGQYQQDGGIITSKSYKYKGYSGVIAIAWWTDDKGRRSARIVANRSECRGGVRILLGNTGRTAWSSVFPLRYAAMDEPIRQRKKSGYSRMGFGTTDHSDLLWGHFAFLNGKKCTCLWVRNKATGFAVEIQLRPAECKALKTLRRENIPDYEVVQTVVDWVIFDGRLAEAKQRQVRELTLKAMRHEI